MILFSFLRKILGVTEREIRNITNILQSRRRAFVSALSAVVVLAAGVTGSRSALTSFAQTPDPARAGQLVVGYLLTQEVLRREEVQEAAAAQIEEMKKQIAREQEEKIASGEFSVPGVPCSGEDYQTLLKIVEAEAGICDDKGKILVANVVLNRVRSGEFPNTIREVVYQPSQFSPVSNGSINTCRITRETVECVGRALAGEDYSQGALYFMNRRAARNGAASWFDGRLTFLFSHDGHEFFK